MKKCLIILMCLLVVLGCKKEVTHCDKELYNQPSFLFAEISDSNFSSINLNYINKGEQYFLQIFNNGTYIYFKKLPIQQEIAGNLSNEKVVHLINEFEKYKFNYLKREYVCSEFTDAGYTEVILNFGNKTYSVGEYNSDGPKELHVLEKLLLDVIKTNKTPQ